MLAGLNAQHLLSLDLWRFTVGRFKNTHYSDCCFPLSLLMQVCHYMTCQHCENNSYETHDLATDSTHTNG